MIDDRPVYIYTTPNGSSARIKVEARHSDEDVVRRAVVSVWWLTRSKYDYQYDGKGTPTTSVYLNIYSDSRFVFSVETKRTADYVNEIILFITRHLESLPFEVARIP